MAPQRPIGFWLKLVDQLINEQFEKTLDEHGVTRRQWQLMNLLTSGPASRSQLDEALSPFLSGSEQDSSAEELAELVDSEWVLRDIETFALTERGRTSFDRLSEVVGRNRETIGRSITAEEYASTLEVLERMAHNLGWNDPVPQ